MPSWWYTYHQHVNTCGGPQLPAACYGINTTMTADEFEKLVREKLIQMDGTAIGCARGAKLPRDAIRSVFRGHEPKLGRAEEICRALGLEFYIGEPRAGYTTVKPSPVSPDQVNDHPPVFTVTDENLWQLIGAFADEWEAADAHGREMLETRFRAYFPELVKGA